MANEAAVKMFFANLQALGVAPRDGFSLEGAARIWAEALGGEISEAELRSAALLWSRTPEGRWWPTPGDVLRLVREAQRPEVGGEDLWAVVLKYGAHFGMYRLQGEKTLPPIFKDVAQEARAQAAIATVGGWRGIMLVSEDELPHVRRHWCAAYDRILEREITARSGAVFGRAVQRIEERQARQIEQRDIGAAIADLAAKKVMQ